MKKLTLRFKRSLPGRLLLVFVLISACVTFLVIGTLIHGFSSQWEAGITPHLVQYLHYINSDIGNPPNVEKAEELAKHLPLNIYINGGGINYSSTGTPLDQSDLEFHTDDTRGRESRFHPKIEVNGQEVAFVEHRDRTVLRNQIGDFQVYYELPHNNQSSPRGGMVGKALLSLLGILALSYFILRSMLRPVQDIKTGVRRMGQGELDYRVPIRADNDLGELSDSINNMAKDIEDMLDAKRQLLLAVSHELRSPLTRAKIATQMLDASTNRDRIEEDLLEMEALITEILETERMNSRHAALIRAPINIEALVRSVLHELSAEKVTVHVQDGLPIVTLDETRIRLLVRNLVANAVGHGGEAIPPPSVNLLYSDNTVTIKVCDSGPGIPEEHLSKVTEPFYRADPSRTRATGGFGIGLYLCKLIVEAHGGHLAIRSTPNKGTVVDVAFPIDQRTASL